MRYLLHFCGLVLCFCSTNVFAELTLRSVDDFDHTEAVAEAIELYDDGEGEAEDLAAAYPIFKTAAESGDPVSDYYLGHMHLYANGAPLDESLAWTYFQQAASSGVSEALGRMGWMLDAGLGRDKNSARAIRYYRRAALTDPQSAVNLAFHIMEGRAKGTESEVIQMMEMAVARDSKNALNNLGYYHTFAKLSDPDPEYGVELLERALEQDHLGAAENLDLIWSGRTPLIEGDKDKLKALIKPRRLETRLVRKEILQAVHEYKEHGIEAGLDRLEDKLELWMRSNSIHRFRRQVWWEAQVLSGKQDPEWSYHLYSWLFEKCKEDYLERNPGEYYCDITMLSNLSKEQLATGRIASMADTAELIRKDFLINSKINLRLEPQNSLNYGQPVLPDVEKLKTIVRRQPGAKWREERVGLPIWYADIIGLDVIASSKFYQGDWRKTLGYDEWIGDWVHETIKDDMPKPVGPAWEIRERRSRMRVQMAEVYETLGFYDKALDIYSVLIGEKDTAYKSRYYHIARTLHALLATSLGRSELEDLESLAELRELRANNKFAEKRAPLEVDLVTASYLRLKDKGTEAYEKLNGIITAATSARLFPIRIQALKKRIIWKLEDGLTQGVEEDLIVLLELCRSKGLKIVEPELYHLYALFEASGNDLEKAIHLQLKAIEFYKGFDLYTWLPLRYIELAEWYLETGNLDLAEYYMNLAKQLINQPGAEYPQWIVEKTRETFDRLIETLKRREATVEDPAGEANQGGETSVADAEKLIDLQPAQVTSIPMENKPAIGIFTLVNNGTSSQTIQLIATGRVESLSKNELGDLEVHMSSETEVQNSALELELQGNWTNLIYVYAPSGHQPLELKLSTAIDGGKTVLQTAQFSFPESEGVFESAVINAVYLEGNPYYMTSAFHLLQRSEIDGSTITDLRIRSSIPARVEGYSATGELIFVDADGDGAFVSPGDILRKDVNNNGFPDIEFEANADTTSIELMFKPEELPSDGNLEFDISTRDASGWNVDSSNTIQYNL